MTTPLPNYRRSSLITPIFLGIMALQACILGMERAPDLQLKVSICTVQRIISLSWNVSLEIVKNWKFLSCKSGHILECAASHLWPHSTGTWQLWSVWSEAMECSCRGMIGGWRESQHPEEGPAVPHQVGRQTQYKRWQTHKQENKPGRPCACWRHVWRSVPHTLSQTRSVRLACRRTGTAAQAEKTLVCLPVALQKTEMGHAHMMQPFTGGTWQEKEVYLHRRPGGRQQDPFGQKLLE